LFLKNVFPDPETPNSSIDLNFIFTRFQINKFFLKLKKGALNNLFFNI
jgi:hypothetical protein